jgi:hypothetical protein
MTFRSGPNGETYHFYDQPAYDAFWRLVVKLDIPICLHTGPYLQTLFLTTLAEEKILLWTPSFICQWSQSSFAGHVYQRRIWTVSLTQSYYWILRKAHTYCLNLNASITGSRMLRSPLPMKRAIHLYACEQYMSTLKEKIWVTTSGHFLTANAEAGRCRNWCRPRSFQGRISIRDHWKWLCVMERWCWCKSYGESGKLSEKLGVTTLKNSLSWIRSNSCLLDR